MTFLHATFRNALATLIVAWAAVAPIIFVVCVCAHGTATVVQRDHPTPGQSTASCCQTDAGDRSEEPEHGDSCNDSSLILDQARSPNVASAFFVFQAWIAVDFSLVGFEFPPFAAIDPIDTGPPLPPPHLQQSPLLQV